MTYTAELTTVNENTDTGIWDTITVSDADGNEVESVRVRPSQDDAPYIAALREAGWVVTGSGHRGSADMLGNPAWTVTSA